MGSATRARSFCHSTCRRKRLWFGGVQELDQQVDRGLQGVKSRRLPIRRARDLKPVQVVAAHLKTPFLFSRTSTKKTMKASIEATLWVVPGNKSSCRDGLVIGFMHIEGKCFVKPTLLTMTGPEGRASKRNPKRRHGPRVGPEKEIPNEMLGLKSSKLFCKAA